MLKKSTTNFSSVYQNLKNKVIDGQWWDSEICMGSNKLIIEMSLSSANPYNEVSGPLYLCIMRAPIVSVFHTKGNLFLNFESHHW